MMAQPFNKFIFSIVLSIIWNITLAQNQIQHFKSIELAEVEMVSIDRVGFFYTVQKNGAISKFSEDAELIAQHKQSGKNEFALFEAWNSMQLIGFNKKTKNYILFDRMLHPKGIFNIDNALVVEAALTTITGDNSLWVLDAKVSALKKINLSAETVEIEIPYDSEVSAEFEKSDYIKDYQNMLFINTPSAGIWIYNSIGKKLRTLDFKGVNYFNFLGMDLYFIQEGKLHLYDLYSGDHGIYDLPRAARFVLLTDETMLLADDTHIHFYRIDLTDN
jgi:hypothetical protein